MSKDIINIRAPTYCCNKYVGINWQLYNTNKLDKCNLVSPVHDWIMNTHYQHGGLLW